MPTQCGLHAGKNGRNEIPSNSPGRGIVPKRMPSATADASSLAGGYQMILTDLTRPIRFPVSGLANIHSESMTGFMEFPYRIHYTQLIPHMCS